MIKFVDSKVTFSEIPDEITLCINFSNCPNRCEGCHSAYLQEDIGEYLTFKKLDELIKKSDGITCVCLMGGDNQSSNIQLYAKFIKENFPYKVAWYSGNQYITHVFNFEYFDYIKLGKYDQKLGGLDSPKTNQKLFKIENITYKFLKNKAK